MRIASWNCCQAFYRKWEYVDSFAADVLVVPEAACIERQPAALLERYPNRAWIGDNPSKGLLVLARADFPFEVAATHDPAHRYVLPLMFRGPRQLALLAVWTQLDKTGTYTQHLARAVAAYGELLAGDAVVIGDFNANTIWDRDHRRDVTHSQNVSLLGELGLVSAYHSLTGEVQGKETAATHAFRRNPEAPFHIDYCFATEGLLGPEASLDVRPVSEWVSLSDHAPLVVDLPL